MTISNIGSGVLLLNDVNDTDTTALAFRPSDVPRQMVQDEHKPTYVRATGDGWVVRVDEVA